MSVARRIAMLFRIKANKALDKAEDPREVLDYSYERQVEMLAKVRRGVADVATSRKRLELQAAQLQASADKTAQMRSRAAAIDELLTSGALDDATTPGGKRDDIQAALDTQLTGAGIEAELARLKGQLAGAPDRAAIDAEPPAKAIAGQEAQS